MTAVATGPVRTCVGCGSRDAQHAMLRLAWQDPSLVVRDPRRGTGRSAYLHATGRCVEGLLRSKALGRSLKVAVPKDARASLARRIEGRPGAAGAEAARKGPAAR